MNGECTRIIDDNLHDSRFRLSSALSRNRICSIHVHQNIIPAKSYAKECEKRKDDSGLLTSGRECCSKCGAAVDMFSNPELNVVFH